MPPGGVGLVLPQQRAAADLAGVGAVSAPLSAALNNDPMSTTTMTAVAAVVGGSAACSAALQYYASRYVGELSLLRGDENDENAG